MSHKTRPAYKAAIAREDRMSESKGYNGWTNYETWAANLWMTNEESTMNYWTERAREVYVLARMQSYCSKKQDATYRLAAIMKEDAEAGAEDMQDKGMYSDMLNAAMSEINWNEIAEHFVESVEESLET